MKSDHDKILPIPDAMKSIIPPKVNMMGTISELGLPKRTRGTDSTYFPMLREIKEGDHCSLACKILHCCEAANNEWMLFVWDGTDTPPNFISAKIEDEMHDPLPFNLETRPMPRQILCTFPTVGSILRITIDQGIEKSLIQSLAIGKWVKIVDMRLEVRAGLWHGVLTPFTKLCYTPEEDCLIQGCLRSYDERVSLDWGRMPFTCFPWPSNVTEVDHENVLPVTLMDLLTHSEVTAKFKCIVRAVAIAPWLAENLRSPHGIYRFRLTLEDPTARIHAFVYGEDGETLFDGHPDNSILTEKMNLLLGVPPSDDNSTGAKSALRNPPWVQVCLKSYYTNPDDVWGSRQYRIFDTKIVGGGP